jgi:acyl-coenzyme A thioesterase PaaI-like protein
VNVILERARIGQASQGSVHIDAVIDDAWRISYAHGGVLQAAAIEAAVAAVARDDLDVVSATTTYVRPVSCGPVSAHARVIGGSRSGAVVHVELRDESSAAGTVTTVAFARRDELWPTLSDAVRPAVLAAGPSASDPRMGSVDDGYPVELPFFRSTDWRRAGPGSTAETLGGCAWFRFERPTTPVGREWPSALLAVPADALGFSIVPSVSRPGQVVYALSRQTSLHVFDRPRGEWLGIHSRCIHAAHGLATGVATLWDGDGRPVAAATQTAMLRVMGGS